MRIILLFTLLFTIFSTTFAQNTVVVVKKSFTKTSDVNDPTLTEIASKVNTTRLRDAMQANYSLERKDSLTVHLAFYDRGYIGNLKLKNENPIDEQQYVNQWQSEHTSGNHILFLFIRRFNQAEFEYKTVQVSADMQDQHLFTEVMDFIRAHLSGSPAQVVEKGTRFLANAIKPVWTSAKLGPAKNQTTKTKYHKGNYIHYLEQSFLDLSPVSSPNLQNKVKMYCITKDGKDTVKTNGYILIDTLSFPKGQGSIVLSETPATFTIFGKTIKYGNSSERIFMYKEVDLQMCQLVHAVDQTGYHSPSKKVSKWNWAKGNEGFYLQDHSDLAVRKQNDAVELIKNEEWRTSSGMPMPFIHPSISSTYCNLFAADLSREILFQGYNLLLGNVNSTDFAPWGSNKRASNIHDYVKTSSNFKAIKVDENVAGFVRAWELTNAGYVVYLTSYNHEYYANPPGKIHPGHIATCYPNREMTITIDNWKQAQIIQAGEKTDVLPFNEVWERLNYSNGEKNGNRQKIHAHLYLGYILKTD